MLLNKSPATLELWRFNSEICQPLSVNVYGVKSMNWALCTLNLPSCDAGKKLVLMSTCIGKLLKLIFA